MAENIAFKARLEYLRNNISKFPYVLTCDFMITTQSGLMARTIKLSSDLQNKRTLEKLEIERRYWKEVGIDWKLVTEHEMDKTDKMRYEFCY